MTTFKQRVHVRQTCLFLSKGILFSFCLLHGLFNLTQSVYGRIVDILNLVDSDNGEDWLVQA